MAGVIYIFNVSKRTYTLQTELAELHDNARFVMDELTREIRMGGYFGCSDTAPPGAVPFQAVDNVSLDGFPPTDTMIITSFSEQLGVRFNTQLTFGGNTITLTPGSILPDPTDRIVVSDCASSQIYTVNSVAGSVIKVDGSFPQINPPIEVFMDRPPVTYQVGAIPGGGFALFKCDDNNGVCDDDELFVEGVQNMQVRYGIDTSSNRIPNKYIADPSVINSTDSVVSVRITLLMRTTKKRGIICPAKKTFSLDPDLDSYSPHDEEAETGYCHRLFTTTIGVRNG